MEIWSQLALPVSLMAILLAVLVGWKSRTNAGVIAMALACLIKVFFMDGSVNQVIEAWPSKIVFYLIAIALFFNYATANGTMDLLAKKMLYRLRGRAFLIPWVITVVCAVVSFLGAGASTPAIIGPLAFSLGLKAGIHPILLALSVACATTIGGDNPINGYGGVISKGLIEQTVYAEYASKISFAVWMNAVGKQLLVILVASLIFRVRVTQKVEVEKPEEFQPVQRKQLALILGAIAGMLIPMIAVTYAPSEFTRKLVAIMQPQFVMILASLGCAVLHLGSQQVVIEKIPMNTILLISGMSMLLAVAKEAGMVEAISAVMMRGVPKSLVPASLVGFSAFLSFFSSGTGVVCPLLYPMVPHLAQQMGLNPIMLFSCIFVGAMSSSVSPFSTGGAMTIAGCPYRNVKDQHTNWMIPVAILIPVACAVLASVGAFGFFHM